jgi:hypothetical protein
MPKPTPKPPANKPAHEIRLNGVQASIWKNETSVGPRYNTTVSRYYRDGEEWKSSDSFGRDDLLTLSFVSQEALRWIIQQHEQPAIPPRS